MMRNIEVFLAEVYNQEIKLWLEENKLKYAAPPGRLTPALRLELVERKAEVIKFLQQATSLPQVPQLTPLTETTFPLSYGQQALWFIHQQAPKSGAYNMALAVRLQGQLNIPLLHQALQHLINRHAALRTTFFVEQDQPKQTIAPTYQLAFNPIDATHWHEDTLLKQLYTISQQPLNLEQGPLFVVQLFRQATEKHILLLVLHHIVGDATALMILLDDLLNIYATLKQKQPLPSPPIKATYANYVAWERELLQRETGRHLQNYWHEQLGGEIPLLKLPTDYPRPVVQTYNGATCPFKLAVTLTEQLKGLASKNKVTLFTTLLAAFQILLYRYTGQTDIWVGTPTTVGRTQAEFANLVGYLINPVVLRGNLSNLEKLNSQSFLAQLQQTVQTALDHKDYPFALLVQQLQTTRYSSYTPLFQVMFSFIGQSLMPKQFSQTDLQVSNIDIPQMEGQFDLTLSINDGSCLSGNLDYNRDLFEQTTIERMVNHLQTLLSAMVANPEQAIATLPMLTEAEYQQIVVDWNKTETPYPTDKCIHHLFEQQAHRTPNAIALVFPIENEAIDNHKQPMDNGQWSMDNGQWSMQLSYRELNEQANQLAHYLIEQGVGPESLVGLCVERSPEMIIGLLAILKAGGAYVPLDPTYPKERLVFMLENAQISVLLTQEALKHNLPELNNQLICLDSDWANIAQSSVKTPQVNIMPHHLAYIIYTSGSTGQPKGVMIEHGALVAFSEGTKIKYNLSAKDRILQFSTISFDAAGNEIYPCLIAGGTLVLSTKAMLSTAEAFLQQCQKWGITVLTPPTAYWHYLIKEMAQAKLQLPNTVRLVTIGGEKASPNLVKLWTDYVGDYPTFMNEYGPTETTVVSLRYKLNSQLLATNGQRREVPIGNPNSNVKCYILDEFLNPVPIGVIGQLYIGGAQTARGYLNDPSLTAEKFIPNPFIQESGVRSQESGKKDSKLTPESQLLNPDSRLYKTGDLACYLPDGNIEFVGRVDEQIKIRGFRVELNEIETVLQKHPLIREAVVIATTPQNGINLTLDSDEAIETLLLKLGELDQSLVEKLLTTVETTDTILN